MTIVDPITPPAIAMALVDLADCVCAELADSGAGPTCWCGLYPGATVSWEYCGECQGGLCGMGYVRLAGVFPYETFPLAALDARCVLPLAWAIEVGSLRCFPQTEEGVADPVTMAETSLNQVLDARAIWKAVKCCGMEVSVESWRPVGPQGGCVGGFWLAYLAVD